MTYPRRSELGHAERIVVKVGTGVVTHDGIDLALGRLSGIVEDLATLHKRGRTVVLVSSGAVGMGMRVLGRTERPSSLGLRQACAAVGQGHLISLYNQAFGHLGVTTAQVLLTQEDLADRERALCLRTTLMRLLQLRTLPILNENDSVSVRELAVQERGDNSPAFGDNDGLSARVAVALDADVLVLMTDVDGLYTANPRTDPGAQRIPALEGIDEDVLARATGHSKSGTGGMLSKLEAARVATDAGTTTLIVDGTMQRVLPRVLLEHADLGTAVWPRARRRARERLIAFGATHRGALVVNDGALQALSGAKASLLPIGVVAVEGDFARGDVVEIRDERGRVHGRGIVNYDARACGALKGHHSSEIGRILGVRGYDALVTRDNLVLGEV